MKPDRKRVYDKFGGKCAYCGCDLNGKFQIDHLIPQSNFEWHIKNSFRVPSFLSHLTVSDVNHIDNLMPACASCNNYKRTFCLETFRSELQRQPEILRRDRPTVRLAERFGLIKIEEKQVVFHFESQLTPNQ